MVQGFDKYIGNNTYTSPRRVKRDNVTPIQGPVLKNDAKYNFKIYSFNVIFQTFDEKIMNDLTIKYFYAPKIMYPTI